MVNNDYGICERVGNMNCTVSGKLSLSGEVKKSVEIFVDVNDQNMGGLVKKLYIQGDIESDGTTIAVKKSDCKTDAHIDQSDFCCNVFLSGLHDAQLVGDANCMGNGVRISILGTIKLQNSDAEYTVHVHEASIAMTSTAYVYNFSTSMTLVIGGDVLQNTMDPEPCASSEDEGMHELLSNNTSDPQSFCNMLTNIFPESLLCFPEDDSDQSDSKISEQDSSCPDILLALYYPYDLTMNQVTPPLNSDPTGDNSSQSTVDLDLSLQSASENDDAALTSEDYIVLNHGEERLESSKSRQELPQQPVVTSDFIFYDKALELFGADEVQSTDDDESLGNISPGPQLQSKKVDDNPHNIAEPSSVSVTADSEYINTPSPKRPCLDTTSTESRLTSEPRPAMSKHHNGSSISTEDQYKTDRPVRRKRKNEARGVMPKDLDNFFLPHKIAKYCDLPKESLKDLLRSSTDEQLNFYYLAQATMCIKQLKIIAVIVKALQVTITGEGILLIDCKKNPDILFNKERALIHDIQNSLWRVLNRSMDKKETSLAIMNTTKKSLELTPAICIPKILQYIVKEFNNFVEKNPMKRLPAITVDDLLLPFSYNKHNRKILGNKAIEKMVNNSNDSVKGKLIKAISPIQGMWQELRETDTGMAEIELLIRRTKNLDAPESVFPQDSAVDTEECALPMEGSSTAWREEVQIPKGEGSTSAALPSPELTNMETTMIPFIAGNKTESGSANIIGKHSKSRISTSMKSGIGQKRSRHTQALEPAKRKAMCYQDDLVYGCTPDHSLRPLLESSFLALVQDTKGDCYSSLAVPNTILESLLAVPNTILESLFSQLTLEEYIGKAVGLLINPELQALMNPQCFSIDYYPIDRAYMSKLKKYLSEYLLPLLNDTNKHKSNLERCLGCQRSFMYAIKDKPSIWLFYQQKSELEERLMSIRSIAQRIKSLLDNATPIGTIDNATPIGTMNNIIDILGLCRSRCLQFKMVNKFGFAVERMQGQHSSLPVFLTLTKLLIPTSLERIYAVLSVCGQSFKHDIDKRYLMNYYNDVSLVERKAAYNIEKTNDLMLSEEDKKVQGNQNIQPSKHINTPANKGTTQTTCTEMAPDIPPSISNTESQGESQILRAGKMHKHGIEPLYPPDFMMDHGADFPIQVDMVAK